MVHLIYLKLEKCPDQAYMDLLVILPMQLDMLQEPIQDLHSHYLLEPPSVVQAQVVMDLVAIRRHPVVHVVEAKAKDELALHVAFVNKTNKKFMNNIQKIWI
jgi:hypothetical protein